jgi:hypothetical protein
MIAACREKGRQDAHGSGFAASPPDDAPKLLDHLQRLALAGRERLKVMRSDSVDSSPTIAIRSTRQAAHDSPAKTAPKKSGLSKASRMLALPERHQSRPFWQYAAERGDRVSVDDAAAQLSRALAAEGLL